ncbi:hypothetical protein HGB07_01025 [Candidatus Roizmanbacteria bacterium]|nr:hypothetical protein [Candidatus Roizmanbacteria bacterium]
MNNTLFFTLVAAVAAIVSSVQLIPQVISVFRAKNLNGVSTTTFLLFTFTYSLWLIHGIHQHDLAIIGANICCVICSASILVIKFLKSRKLT